MSKIILDLTASLDGFIEGKNREIDWITFDDEIGKDLLDFADEIDTVLYGRVSYELFGNYQPDANANVFEKAFYKKVNAINKYVFSNNTSLKVDENTVLVHHDITDAVRNIKQNAVKNIWLFGGSGLVSTFLNLDLIDEIRIGINPVILTAGNPLFKAIEERKQLKLINTKRYQSGVVGLYYTFQK